MFKRIVNAISKTFNQETLEERSSRMLPGVLYGAIVATVFVLISSIINVLFFPDLHLAVDWIGFLIRWLEFGIALALAGAIVGWFSEEYMGIVGGGIILTTLILIGNLIASLIGNGSATLMVQSFFTALPLIGVCIILAWALRTAINRHLHIKQHETPGMRWKMFVQMIFIVCLVGLIPGVFSRFGLSSENAIRTLNKSLQNTTTTPPLEVRFPIANVPAIKGHIGMDYKMYTRTSSEVTGALDITIRFVDGYTITCIVPTDSSSAYLDACNEGTRITNP